jgi:MFS family permease
MVLMFVTAVGVACSDVVIDALMVETGQRTGRVKLFQGVQWTCISLAGIASAFAGGQLSQHLSPHRAVQVAAATCAGVAATIAVVAWLLVREPRSRLDLVQLRATASGIWSALRSLRLWLVLLYLMLAHYNPGMETPLYLHVTKTMGLSESTYGMISTVVATGYLAGAALFTTLVAPRFSTRASIVIGMLAIGAGMLSFLLVRGERSAYAAAAAYGTGYMLSALALLSLAAEACPRRAEGFTFAAIMSVMNFAMQFADYSGSLLYERVFHRAFWPLPILAASVTLLAVALVPLLPRHPQPAAEKEGAAA